MENVMYYLAKYATPEVITVLGSLLTAWLGWKVAAKSFGLISAVAQKCSFIGLTAAVLFVCGLGSTGLGMGEVASRWSSQPKETVTGIDNGTLVNILKETKDARTATEVLEYAKVRDGNDRDVEFRRIVNLVEKSGDKEAVVQLLKLMQQREDKRTSSDVITVASASNSPVNIEREAPVPAEARPIPQAVGKESLLSVQQSLLCIATGLALSICGIVCWRNRHPSSYR